MFLSKVPVISTVFRRISLDKFGALDNEITSVEKDLRPSHHILNESESVGGLEMIADFSEISRHILHINR